MRKTAAKRIRKFDARNAHPKFFRKTCRKLKRDWNSTPRNLRFTLRQELE